MSAYFVSRRIFSKGSSSKVETRERKHLGLNSAQKPLRILNLVLNDLFVVFTELPKSAVEGMQMSLCS